MCNSSFQLTNSSAFDESLDWYCFCSGHFGPPLFLITSALCFFVGMPIHCWSFWVYLRTGNIKPNLVFPLNITLMELLFCIQCIIDVIDVRFPSMFSYRIANFLICVNWTVRPTIQTCMCIEQYLAVLHPVTFLKYKSIQSRIRFAGAVWLIAVGNSLRQIFTGLEYFRDHVFFVCFCIAVIIVSFCCVSVLCALKRPGPVDRNKLTEKDRHNKTDRGRACENQQKLKAFRKICHILASILICYVPLVTVYFINKLNIKELLYICEAVPLLLSFTMITILFSPIVRMYNENHLKLMMCFSNPENK